MNRRKKLPNPGGGINDVESEETNYRHFEEGHEDVLTEE